MRQWTEFQEIASELWEAEHHRYEGMHLRMRMTVVRRSNGSLWLHSPVPIDAELADKLATLGHVTDIVAPNRFHYRFAAAAKALYPAAALWAAPGLSDKRPEIRFDGELSDRVPWASELNSLLVQGAPAWNEHVFFHAPSRALICSDLLFNVAGEPQALTRLLYRALGVGQRFGTNRLWKWRTRDRPALAATLRRILEWKPERVIMAHGDVVRLRHERELEQAFEPLIT